MVLFTDGLAVMTRGHRYLRDVNPLPVRILYLQRSVYIQDRPPRVFYKGPMSFVRVGIFSTLFFRECQATTFNGGDSLIGTFEPEPLVDQVRD